MPRFGLLTVLTLVLSPGMATAQHDHGHGHDHRDPVPYAAELAHAPTPLPDRVVLTWSEDPATTQSVTWRTDTSVTTAVAEVAVANANGRALEPRRFAAETTDLRSDLNQAHYHSVTSRDLQPDTLDAYRVGDGVNWSEYYHFRTASDRRRPFSFIYFGDAQNEIKTHWSRVFREAFRDAPRAAFTLHAGDLINEDAWDAEWGEWHGAPAWVNGTIPVIATPGNHEYYRANQGPAHERYWSARDGRVLAVDVEMVEARNAQGAVVHQVTARASDGRSAYLEIDDDDRIILVGKGVEALTGFSREELLGTDFDGDRLDDRLRDEGEPMVSDHWRPQFAFRLAEDTQWYQVIDTNDAQLRFRAFTATGELYVAFTLEKRDGQPNRLREVLPSENRSPR